MAIEAGGVLQAIKIRFMGLMPPLVILKGSNRIAVSFYTFDANRAYLNACDRYEVGCLLLVC